MDSRPETTVQELIERMQRVHGDRRRARAAFELLTSKTKQNLAERALRASALVGRDVGPEEMLAPSHFWLTTTPLETTAQIHGDTAEVTVVGASPQTERYQLQCTKENGRWRVALELPSPPPVQKRNSETRE